MQMQSFHCHAARFTSIHSLARSLPADFSVANLQRNFVFPMVIGALETRPGNIDLAAASLGLGPMYAAGVATAVKSPSE